MTQVQIRRAALSVLMLLGAAGCAGFPHMPRWASIKPIRTAPSAPAAAREDGYYADAVAAISRRDYARALDLLQAARARKADDIRVLNAFGVVYDKLGRFDLSARYYAEAKAIDAASPILASNIAYSETLRQEAQPPLVAAVTVMAEEVRPAPTGEPARIVVGPPAVIRLDFPSEAAVVRTAPYLTGRPLVIADASGRKGGAEPVRARLIRLGWSAPKAVAHDAPAQARTTISYPARIAPAARALARTLPPGVRLVDCGHACDGVHLTLGADSLGWTLRPRSGAARGA